MKALWQDYSAKFLTISAREQYLVLITGLIAITFIFFNVFIDEKLTKIDTLTKNIQQINTGLQSSQTTINILQQSLSKDPNVAIQKQIAQYEEKLASVDSELLLLTSDLINPIQMRYALIDLLKTQPSVSLLSFEVMEAQPMTNKKANDRPGDSADESEIKADSEQSLTLYKHGIKLKLKGSYFNLRDYLSQLEKMDWTFFWQEFDYQLIEYPNSELSIEMYSLSTKKEFIGV
jgi:MSHA biogenesis protein MshJ